ncbi:formylglycine-generating enzyme family protein [Celeribacter sp.]|uniref:formylglycine-generating enzyme family protein n=1 Tax=Celeribacter sp. TaxID=1890673 RepID=UPI003A95129B
MTRKSIVLLSAGAIVLVVAGGLTFNTFGQKHARANLIDSTRATMVFVEGGTFTMGNYRAPLQRQDGTVIDTYVADHSTSETRQVTVDSFYIAPRQVTQSEAALFDRAQGRARDVAAGMENRPAAFSHQEATAYCAWLGDAAGLPMRLPTEAEWEYMARSRGQTPFWPTDNGSFEYGRNVFDLTTLPRMSQDRPDVASFPPNPLGIYDLSGGLADWVSDRAASDPEEAIIFKGGSDDSSAIYSTVPTRGMSDSTGRAYEATLKAMLTGAYESAEMEEMGQLYGLPPTHVGARCVVELDLRPAETGFGILPGPIQLSPPYHATSPQGRDAE